MAFGIDYVTMPPMANLKAAGVTFACRYLSEVNAATKVKLLTLAEAKANGAAGISTVSNYEWYGNRALEGAASGKYDAGIAASQHLACGGPASRPIYFSVDFDAQPSQMAAVIDYSHGVASVIGLDRTGAYGSYSVIKALFDAHAITWGWQTYAWSGGAWEPRAQLQQYQNGVDMAGISVDYDRSMTEDFGQWVPQGGHMIPQGWKDNGTTLTAPNGVEVIQGFREWILTHPWDSANWPLAPSAGRDPLEDSNTSLGAGTFQMFRMSMLEWTSARGVFVSWIGQELLKAREELAAKQAPTPAPVDTTALISSINAIADGVAPLVAAALVQAKKL